MASESAATASGPLCAIVSGGERLFGFAVFDPEKRALQVCEYHEDSHLSRGEALLLQVQPQTCCFMLSETEDAKKLGRVAQSCGVACEEAKAANLKQVDLEQDLLRLLQDTAECGLGRHLEEQRRKQGMRALAALLGHFGLLAEPSNFGACSLGLYPLSSFMYLDKAAFSALNILPRPEESLRSTTSLLGFLNRTRSPVGVRRLRQWLTQPLTVPDEVSMRHDVVEALSGDEGLLRQVESHLRHVPDLDRIAARLHCTGSKATRRNTASLEDMVLLYRCVLGTESMATELASYGGVHSQVLKDTIVQKLQACASDCANYRRLVEQTIDLKQADQRNFCICTAFDPSLGQLASTRDQVKDRMEAVRKKVEAELKLPSARGKERLVALVECPEGLALRVTKKNQQSVQTCKDKTKFKVLAFKKMECIFTTPELERMNKELNDAIATYDKQSAQLVTRALAVAATYSPVADRLSEVWGSLDVLASFARVVATAPCTFVRATIDPTGKTFEVEGAVHALVVANSDKSFVANGLTMHEDSSRLHLITGPNMGGKSTYIRSMGLIALLNQVGCFVPCRRAVLPLFDAVMCRVGASDMQLRGISTFMAEMLEAACILSTATPRSLVIVDELGRGTSTSDGFGIAWAIARHLAEETRCFTLFATHFHELAALEQELPAVRNRHATAAVDAASGQLTFLYAIQEGAADQSYGAHVAELAGFPARVVATARRRAREFEADSSFGRAAKRPCGGAAGAEDLVSSLLSAGDEDEFARRATEKLPALQEMLREPASP